MRTRLLLLIVLSASTTLAEDVQKLCQSVAGSTSCGQCIKQHPDCAWCRDPHSKTSSRCQLKNAFTPDVCAPQYVYSPTTQLIVSDKNLPLEALRSDGQTIVQLTPQQAQLKLKPGATLEVPFKYLHKQSLQGYEVREVLIQTSEVKTRGISIEFEINCEGEIRTDRRCPGVREGQVVDITAKVTLTECQSSGDVAVSLGVYGYNTVSALFITPLCGCECEKLQQQEKNSPLCYNDGDLICGRCECKNGKGGPRCKCPLASYGVNNADELDDKCRKTPQSLVCSGKGTCDCGVCKCASHTITGQFCECDHSACPVNAEGKTCSAQGVCECGTCKCEAGFGGPDCSCSDDTTSCTENGLVCSDHGKCECGKCLCYEGYTGAFCGAVETITNTEKDQGETGDAATQEGGEAEVAPADQQPAADANAPAEGEGNVAADDAAADGSEGAVDGEGAEAGEAAESTGEEGNFSIISSFSLALFSSMMIPIL